MGKVVTPISAVVGRRVRSNTAFAEVPVGSTGEIVEDYGSGIMVKWDHIDVKDGFNKARELVFLEFID